MFSFVGSSPILADLVHKKYTGNEAKVKANVRRTVVRETSRDSVIWEMECKVRALGELIKFQSREPSLEEEEVNFGIGLILTDFADGLREMRK